MSVLYGLDALILTLAIVVLAAAAAELGFRVARRRARANPDAAAAGVGPVEGVVFGLFGLLLALTFSFVVTRSEVRRQLIMEEANAIETSFLRSAIAPEARRAALQRLHRRYVASRVAFFEAGGDGARAARALEEAQVLQGELWSQAVSVALSDPGSELNPLMLEALNDMFDVRGRRTGAWRARLPDAVVVMLLITTVLTASVTGYSLGLRGERHPAPSVVFLLLTTVVLYIILDIDRPGRGLLGSRETALAGLAARLGATP